MTERDTTGRRWETYRSRREVLAGLGAAGMVGLAGCGGGGSNGGTATPTPTSEFANYPVGETVTIGASIPRTGTFSDEGRQMKAAYQLAVDDLNEGAGFVANGTFDALSGGGIRDKQVEMVVEDTESTPEGARASARRLLDREGVILLTGGASGREALPQQAVATERRAVYMAGFAPADSLNGSECSRYGFTEMANPSQIAAALEPAAAETFGTGLNYVQVYPRTPSGEQLFGTMQTALGGKPNWQLLASERTRVNTNDYTSAIKAAAARGPDALVLNYYGLDGAKVLDRARTVETGDVAILAPIIDRTMAANAGSALAGVLGTMHWQAGIGNGPSTAFVRAWQSAYGDDPRVTSVPSGIAHLAYMQVLQYAAAVERAGTFEPPKVIAELERATYDIGLDRETMRACDHRSKRSVPVVRGLPNGQQSTGEYVDLRTVASDVTYGCDQQPASRCSMKSA